MGISYSEALLLIESVAKLHRALRRDNDAYIELENAVGRVVAEDIVSPEATPAVDTSAMDGYAIQSHKTAGASPQKPARFRVLGRIRAGEAPWAEDRELSDESFENDASPCIEIMTGGIFPAGFDACVKYEDTKTACRNRNGLASEILVGKPLLHNANKRLAGSDIAKGQVVVKAGTTLQSHHVLPLASLGIEAVPVVKDPGVAVYSTGDEFVASEPWLPRDTNTPYLISALLDMSVSAFSLGALSDDERQVYHGLEAALAEGHDMILTSGGVSKGRFDHVASVLGNLDGVHIVFHGVSMRPGHPVLFAYMAAGRDEAGNPRTIVPIFCLPGNPGAAAACFRFLVVPYLRILRSQPSEVPLIARLQQRPSAATATDSNMKASVNGHSHIDGVQPPPLDRFQHGVLMATEQGELVARPSEEQSPAKLGPYASASCWIHNKPLGSSKLDAGLVECYPISPGKGLFPCPWVR
ncbi:Molybdopterin molybdenumtransferase [Trichoderma ghanense]|uniref:molybdopterin adenylyltransferase n=1 Tax=Trichoderma ghanense TaxID=65468 RepID=A0ABY2GUF3_9HYPO